MGKKKTVIILLLICILIASVPLILVKNSDFAGSDSLAEESISQINPSYKAWASPILEPPGSETESLLFSLQAAIGAGILGYGLGTLRTRAKLTKENRNDNNR
ncbi:energy-coupling factor ABC transporter substrate-binding protein [Clostridium sp. HBUAS56017]|uniref:energy-coupling factor ABC transporter substrate-binding protein n=1 Tax=Clostridium sp. HBUAS56017 TaxID=2571128 RepID=UPI001177A38E|nr:energy-coupling factor ABC transporter substrate-binding protein [Clostridium sp. HBUAS56017]